MAVLQKITAWSYSRYRDYVQCPAKAGYKHVQKLKEPGNAAMERGLQIHKLAEQYAGGQLKALPAELVKFKTAFNRLKKSSPQCEQDWAFNEDWGRVGWFDPDVWLRVKVDAACNISPGVYGIIDHKTGKVYDDYDETMELYAMAGFLIFRDAQTIETMLWFLDVGDEVCKTYTRDQLPALQADWKKKTKAMLSDTRFAPKPNNKCQWCHFRKSNGGPCKF